MAEFDHEHAARHFLQMAERAADFEEATYYASAAAAHASLAVAAELRRARGGTEPDAEPPS